MLFASKRKDIIRLFSYLVTKSRAQEAKPEKKRKQRKTEDKNRKIKTGIPERGASRKEQADHIKGNPSPRGKLMQIVEHRPGTRGTVQPPLNKFSDIYG